MIAAELLARLACGDLDADEELAVEEHVLGCTRCARTLEGLVILGSAVRDMLARAEHGVWLPVTSAIIDQLDADALITRRYTLAPGSTVPCTVGAGDIYSIVFYEGDFAGATRVDIDFNCRVLADVPFEPASRCISCLAPATTLRDIPTMKLPVRVLAFDRDGREWTVGEYVLDHTAFAR